VSNVSVTKMRFLIRGRELDALQLGTVMTHPDYRERGLARELMANITKEYEGQFSFRFLFANDSVTAFYPRFCFVERERFYYTAPLVLQANESAGFRYLDLEKAEDRRILERCLNSRLPLSSAFSLITGQSIALFHALYLFSDALLIHEKEERVLMARQEGETLHLYDAAYPRKIEGVSFLQTLPFSGIREAVFHFTPETDELPRGEWVMEKEADDHFFVDAPQGLFPEKFSFPATGRT